MNAKPTPANDARLPPGPAGLSGLFEVLVRLDSPLEGMTHVRGHYGRVARMPIPGAPYVLLSDPELIEHVLVTDHASYVKDVFMRRMGSDLLGQGLLTSDGDVWRRQRRLVQPAFHQARIAEYASLMVACGEEYVGTLREGQARDVHQDMMELTLEVVLRTLLSIQSKRAATEISEALSVFTDRYAIGLGMTLRTVWGLPMPGDRRFRRAMARLAEMVLDVITARRARGPAAGPADVLDMLLAARDDEGTGVTDAQLRDEVVTMFVAGHETTALALAYAFLCLSRHPSAEAKLRAELASVLDGRAPTLADLPRLRYTEAVVLETMRLYPPAWGFGREAGRDTEIGGYRVPKGTQVLMSPWVLHRDPETFPDPEAFRPERWLGGLQKSLHRFAYMPFGGGPRKCIGHGFAMIEAPLLLATIAQRFQLRVTLDPARPLRFVLCLTLRPKGGLPARVEAV